MRKQCRDNKLLALDQAFIKKHLREPNSKTYFPVGTRSKTPFLTSAAAVDTQQMAKIE